MNLLNKLFRKEEHKKDIIVLHVDAMCDTDALDELSDYVEKRLETGFALAVPHGVSVEIVRGVDIKREGAE